MAYNIFEELNDLMSIECSMPEQVHHKSVFSLTEVTRSIQKTLLERYSSTFWVKAEMNKLNDYAHSGHCYPELVEKVNGKTVAQIKSVMWRDDYQRINRNFLTVLKEPLKDGIKILFEAKITFDPLYGLSLLILDIDPSFTLGDLEREKQETLQQLKEEGIFDRNKQLPLPILPQRIAIISVESSKGYADFLRVIEGNAWGYKFFHMLFPSLLQGDKAVDSIITQLRRIRTVIRHFDAVAIIRGGGGDIGLSCFNHYDLAKEIALFPIPVLTGIGHATNEKVAEMISHSNAITPTKLAEFLLQHFHQFSVPVQQAERKVLEMGRRIMIDEQNRFQSLVKWFRSLTENSLSTHRNEIESLSRSMLQQVQFRFRNEQGELMQMKEKLKVQSHLVFKSEILELNHLEKNIEHMNPVNVLKRGYSITYLNGKAVTDAQALKSGDQLQTVLYQGQINSVVEAVQKTKEP
ncbi:MAG: exodeoxyribonuclease VII large subunit [Chitinophagaceae bacterium]|nr:exodeoxyribonuclease VII large subunit [Chitinophagaceae bacterium]